MKMSLRLLILLFCGSVTVLATAQNRDTVLIDFGTVASPAPYNNITSARAQDPFALANTDGNQTGYEFVMTDIFNGVNTGGSQTPAAAVGLAGTATGDSFFGNVGVFGGVSEPTGAFEIRKLNPALTYTFTVFASRTGATDIREAKYVLRGMTVDSANLNATDNADRVVTLSLKPTADSTITLTASPGPNNDNSTKFYFIGALRMSYDEQEVPVVVTTPADTFLVDFGTVLSPLPWNNVTDARKDSTYALMDEEGRMTAVKLTLVDSFNNVNTNGTQMPAPALGLPNTATGDSFFGNTTPFGGQVQPTGGVELSGLNPDLTYSVRLFGSRAATDNREAKYLVTGATKDSTFVDGASNTDRIGEVSLKPTSSGTIRVIASAGPNNSNGSKFYYLGAMTVSTDPTQSGLDSVLVDFGSTASLTPAPANNITNPADGRVDELTNARGFATGYGIAVVDSFNNINTTGSINPNPSIGIPASATGDSFFGNTTPFGGRVEPTGAVELTGLDPAIEYTVAMLATRVATNNREVRFDFSGARVDSAFVNAASNDDEVGSARMRPDAQGRIRVTVSAGANNETDQKFYYLNALLLTYPQQAPAGAREITLLDPNGGEELQVGKTFDIKWDSRNVKRVALAYSADSGATYVPIDTVDALSGRYAWTIPDAATMRGLVRISEGSIADTSNAVFTITTDTTTCTIVIVGSSSAQGVGANPIDSSWANRFAQDIAGDNTKYRVVNIARGGYTTFHMLPNGSTRGNGVGIAVDTMRNITAALKEKPFAIIIAMPSNDASRFFSVGTQLRNFAIVDSVGRANGARMYISTTQPRNFNNEAQRQNLIEVRDSIFAQYGDFAIDFFNPIGQPNGFQIDSLGSGDGIHLNNQGHRRLFEQVRAKRIDTMSCDLLVSSIRELAEKAGRYGLRVYPNPMQGERVYLDLGSFISEAGEVEVTWLDVLGRTVGVQRRYMARAEEVLTLDRPAAVAGRGFLYCKVLRLADGRSVAVPVME